MKNVHIKWKAATLLIAVFALAVPLTAQAAGTDRNVSITNRAVVNYQVSGVGQPLIESSPAGNSTSGAGNGTDTTFVVDDKVMVTVTNNDGATVTTAPGASGLHAMKFTVTNVGNGAHDFAISAATLSDTMTGGATVALYEDTDGDGSYTPGADNPAGDAAAVYLLLDGGTAYIDEMPATGATSSRVVFVVITTPAGASNGQTANYSLTATAHNDLAEVRAGGTAGSLGTVTVANTGDADDPSLLDIVLADAAGDGDAAYDGMYTANGGFGFIVASVTLSVQKTSAVISDGISGSNPKAIPGAIVEYTIRVTYTGGSGTATSIELSDAVPANTVAVENQYGGTGEVERLTHDNTGPVDTTTNLDETADAAILTSWGTAAASTITALCGMSFDEVGDYCQIKFRVQIQ